MRAALALALFARAARARLAAPAGAAEPVLRAAPAPAPHAGNATPAHMGRARAAAGVLTAGFIANVSYPTVYPAPTTCAPRHAAHLPLTDVRAP